MSQIWGQELDVKSATLGTGASCRPRRENWQHSGDMGNHVMERDPHREVVLSERTGPRTSWEAFYKNFIIQSL